MKINFLFYLLLLLVFSCGKKNLTNTSAQGNENNSESLVRTTSYSNIESKIEGELKKLLQTNSEINDQESKEIFQDVFKEALKENSAQQKLDEQQIKKLINEKINKINKRKKEDLEKIEQFAKESISQFSQLNDNPTKEQIIVAKYLNDSMIKFSIQFARKMCGESNSADCYIKGAIEYALGELANDEHPEDFRKYTKEMILKILEDEQISSEDRDKIKKYFDDSMLESVMKFVVSQCGEDWAQDPYECYLKGAIIYANDQVNPNEYFEKFKNYTKEMISKILEDEQISSEDRDKIKKYFDDSMLESVMKFVVSQCGEDWAQDPYECYLKGAIVYANDQISSHDDFRSFTKQSIDKIINDERWSEEDRKMILQSFNDSMIESVMKFVLNSFGEDWRNAPIDYYAKGAYEYSLRNNGSNNEDFYGRTKDNIYLIIEDQQFDEKNREEIKKNFNSEMISFTQESIVRQYGERWQNASYQNYYELALAFVTPSSLDPKVQEIYNYFEKYYDEFAMQKPAFEPYFSNQEYYDKYIISASKKDVLTKIAEEYVAGTIFVNGLDSEEEYGKYKYVLYKIVTSQGGNW